MDQKKTMGEGRRWGACGAGREAVGLTLPRNTDGLNLEMHFYGIPA